MALDVYVMPLWKFRVGDFTPPVESATALRPKVITPDGFADPPTQVGWYGRWRAKRQVAAIRRAVATANRGSSRVQWNDEGDAVYRGQSPGFEALRAYARWIDCRDQFREFESPPEGNYYKHPVLAIKVEKLSCPQLVEHNCHSGYFLPCEFERMAMVEKYLLFDKWPMFRPVGSSPRLLRELEHVQSVLSAQSGGLPSAESPLTAVRNACDQLREIAELSCRNGLPIIFWG